MDMMSRDPLIYSQLTTSMMRLLTVGGTPLEAMQR